MGPKCAKKISPTPLHHHQQPEPLRQGRMDPCFHVLYAKFWLEKSRLIRPGNIFPILYCLMLVILCELYPPFPVLSRQDRHPVWSSAAGAHLLQGSTCCVFRDGILHTLVVMSGYLSYCCLSIISNQSVHSPLTSDINKSFSSTQLSLTGYFLFFGPFSVNPRDGCVWKYQYISSFWNTQTSPSDTNNHSTFSHLNPLSSPFWCSVWTSARLEYWCWKFSFSSQE